MKLCASAWGIVIVFLSVGMARLQGATNYWDNNGADEGFGSAAGSWGTEAKWSADPAGGSEPLVTDTTTGDDLFFGTESEGLGAGTITIQGTAQGFNSLTFGEASGAILLTNGTLALAEPYSTVTVNNLSNVIASALTGAGGLRKRAVSLSATYTGFLTTNSAVIVQDRMLSKCARITALLAGSAISGGSAAATPYFYTNDGSWAAVQLQAVNDSFTKCVKVELTQTGPDIAARAVYAKYVSGPNLGFDFDAGGSTYSVATSPNGDGYGVSQLDLLFGLLADNSLTLAGVNTYTGDTRVEEDTLELAGSGQLGGGSYTGAVHLTGDLLYRSLADQRLDGAVAGVGRLTRASSGLRSDRLAYMAFLPTATKLIYTNKLVSLSACVAVEGVLGGAAINSKMPLPATVYHYAKTSTNITYQLQAIDGGHLKCVKVELTQTADGIAARPVYARYFTGGIPGYNFDEGSNTFSIATSYDVHGYGVAESAAVFQRESVLTLAGTNSYTGGTEVRGGVLEVVSTNGLPATGMIQVNGGEMILRVPGMNVGNPGGVGNNNTLFVNSGGKLTLAREFNAGYSRPILLDGGILNCTFFQGNDSANYVNRLTLRNGARTIGYKLRVGYNSSALYTVSGTQPSVIESGLNLARSGSYSLTVDVHDVTSDPLPDLIISGVIRDYDASFSELPFIKTGPGTLSLSGANTHVGLITVNGGAISLGANATLNPGNPIRLNGGSLEMGAFTNTLGVLTLAANSGLTLGSGQITFADSSAAAWSGTLALTGTLQRFSVRFGTDGSGLTAAQVSAIRLNGEHVRLREDGYLSPGMRGTVLSVY